MFCFSVKLVWRRGQGIYLFDMDPATGILTKRELFPNDSNPAWLAFDPSWTHLYSANEIQDYQGTSAGSVSSYSIDRSNGHLTMLNAVSSRGAGPAHLSVHPSGRYVPVANYHGGIVTVLPIRPGGELALSRKSHATVAMHGGNRLVKHP